MTGPDHNHAHQHLNGMVTPAARIMGTGEMAALIRDFNWAATPLGPIESWSPTLLSTVNLMLSTRVPMQLLWGPDMVLLYNDEFKGFYADRHPAALGQIGRVFWKEVWFSVADELLDVMQNGTAHVHDQTLLPILRNGRMEDVYWSYSYNPIFLPDGSVGGVLNVSQDITQQVLVERHLRDSEARALRILQSIGDAVVVTDANGCVQRMNPVAEDLTGWPIHEAIGMPLAQVFYIVSQSTRKKVESPIDKVKRLGTVVGLANHTILIRRDGSEIHIDDSGAPIRDESGTLTGMVLVFRNIDERYAAEQEREALSARLTQVLEATTDGVVTIDRNWIVTYINAQGARSVANKGNVIGTNHWKTFPEAVYEGSPYVYHYHRAMEQGIPAEFEAYYPDPLDIFAHVTVRPSPDGIVLFFRDVTAERRAERSLKESQLSLARSESELRLITDTVPAFIAYVGLDGRYLRVNRTFEDSFGHPAAYFVGKTLAEIIGPDAPEILRSRGQAALAGHPQHFETVIPTLNGPRTVSINQIPDFDEQGSVRGVVVQAMDITDRKRSDEALIQSEKLAAVGRLAASIAHEINNPLESVTNLIYLARTTDDHDTANEFLETADRELRRAAAITNQTLRFHRQSTSPAEATCLELFESVLSIQQGRIVNSNITLEKRKRAHTPVRCFVGEIRQVLNNLVGNAIDAMHPEGGRLLLRSREAIHHPTGRRGLVLTVADSGPGMSSHTFARAFEPFYTTKDIGGTGLGLWISKEIIARHSGIISLRTSQRLGHSGTVFTVFLPFEAASR
ncbi:PAS domain-containing sensor histidine kinase [Granulicella tundricola]|nr:PAS domain-containing sensor histidine kinase [Granulicella tundricola]